jgi:hypothetical protein
MIIMMRSHIAFTSPLPLLALGAASASEMVHRIHLDGASRPALSGIATLRLSRDRTSLTLVVDGAVRSPAPVILRAFLAMPGEREASRASDGGTTLAEAAIVLEIEHVPGPLPAPIAFQCDFDLAHPQAGGEAARAALRGAGLGETKPATCIIDGMTVLPPLGKAALLIANRVVALIPKRGPEPWEVRPQPRHSTYSGRPMQANRPYAHA